jgi:hypothetical protein
MSPWRSVHPPVLKFRRIMALSLAVRLTILLVAAYVVLHYVKGA